MQQKTLYAIVVFLGVDLVCSLAFLGYALRRQADWTNAGSEAVASARPDGDTAASAKHQGSPASATVASSKNASQAVAEAKQAVDDQLQEQKGAVERSLPAQDGWVTLDELKANYPHEYESLMRQLESDRKRAAETLKKRTAFLADYEPGILTDAEYAEMKEALEFLNECDKNFSEGRKIPDRSADFNTDRIKRLENIVRKYCQGISNCPEEVIDIRRLMISALDSGSNYVPIIPNLKTLGISIGN